MKIIFAVAFLALFCNFAVAKSAVDLCTGEAAIANTIMTSRQNGLPLTDVMASLEKSAAKCTRRSSACDTVAKFTKALAVEAYAQPLFVTQENKQRAIEEFTNDISVSCYNSAGHK